MIGNGWNNPIFGYEGFYNFTSTSPNQVHQSGNGYGIGYNASFDAYHFNNMYGPHNCLDQLQHCNSFPYATNSSSGEGDQVCATADTFCLNNVESFFDIVTSRDEYDVRYLAPNPFPYSFYEDYLNTAKVQSAIGAFTNFSASSPVTGAAFAATGDDAREIGVTAATEYLIDHNVTMILYFGDTDYVCNWIAGEAFAKSLSNIPLYTDGTAGWTNISSSDNVVHGGVVTAGKFSFVRIYESGHEVPFYQPLVSLEMLNRTLHGIDIATGQNIVTDDYVTTGAAESTFVAGNATVQYDVVPLNATYNVTTNEPNPPTGGDAPMSARLMTRFERAEMDAKKMAKRDADDEAVAWGMRRRATTRTGRLALMDHYNRGIPKRGAFSGRAWRSEL